MDIRQTTEEGAVVLEILGRLDGGTSDLLAARLAAVLAERPATLVLDLAGLDYLSSAGLRVLMVAAKQVRSLQSTLALCALKTNVRELFEISGLTQVFAIYPERRSAVAGAA